MEIGGLQRVGSQHQVRALLSWGKQRLALSAAWNLGGKADRRQVAADEARPGDQSPGCSPPWTHCRDPIGSTPPSQTKLEAPPHLRGRLAGMPHHPRGQCPSRTSATPMPLGTSQALWAGSSASGSDLELIISFLIYKQRVMLWQPLRWVRSDPRESLDL